MIEEIRQGNRSAEISVVGGRGFLGGGLVGALSRLDCQVHSFTRQRPFMCDGRLDESILRSEAIFYLATQISPAIAERDPLRVVEENADFRAFLQGLRAARRKPVVVLASSGGTVYDQDCAPPFSERSPTRPTSAYGLAKLAQEAELHASAGWTIPVTLRLGNVYGPGQRTGAGYGVIAHWMKALMVGDPIRILGHAATQRDYVHISDVTAAMLTVIRRADYLRRSGVPVVLNIGSGVPTTLAQIHQGLEQVVHRTIDVERSAARSFDRRDVWLDVGLARETLGWKPTIALAPGLLDTWRHEIGQIPLHAIRAKS